MSLTPDLTYIPTALIAVALLLGLIGAGSLSRKRYISGGVVCGGAVAVLFLTAHWAIQLRLQRQAALEASHRDLIDTVAKYCATVDDMWDGAACYRAAEHLGYAVTTTSR